MEQKEIELSKYLKIMKKEALKYPDISEQLFNLFEENVYDIIADPNENTDAISMHDNGKDYIYIPDGLTIKESAKMAADNLITALREGKDKNMRLSYTVNQFAYNFVTE